MSNLKKGENKHERFKRLASRRVLMALEAIRKISNLGNRSNYQYSEYEVTEIFSALDRALRDARSHFRSGRKATHFSLQ